MVTNVTNMRRPKTKVPMDTVVVQHADAETSIFASGFVTAAVSTVIEFGGETVDKPRVLFNMLLSFAFLVKMMIAASESGTVISRKIRMARQK
jgi:hypothetical protein